MQGLDMKANFKGHSGCYSLHQLFWLLHELNIVGPENGSHFLKENLIAIAYTSCNGYYMYWTYYVRKREATFKGKSGFYSLHQL